MLTANNTTKIHLGMKNVYSTVFFLLLSFFSLAQLSHLNDEFEDASTLSDWLDITDTEGWGAQHLEIQNIHTDVSGHLLLVPHTSTWFQNLRGSLKYKNISGDFIFTTQVRTTNRAGDGLPGGQFSLAGLMIRTPIDYPNGALNDWQEGQENYIFHSLGRANGVGPQFEIKTTIDSDSELDITAAPANEAQIRLARIGEVIILLHAPVGGDFVIRNRYTRGDFPQDMQIGLVAYTDWDKVCKYNNTTAERFFHNSNVLQDGVANDPEAGQTPGFNPDLRAEFAFARFNEVNVPLALQGADLANPAEVSDAELLDFLGFTSEAALALNILDLQARSSSQQVELFWTTGGGTLPKEFLLEHRTPTSDFQKIASFPAKPTTNYSFVHSNPQNGTNFYRIQQLEWDAKHTYSKTIAIEMNLEPSIAIFPNPAFDKISIFGIENGKVMITDHFGREVQQIEFTQEEIDISGLPAGLYFIHFPNKQIRKRFIKQ